MTKYSYEFKKMIVNAYLNKEVGERILEIPREHKDFEYRRIYGELRKLGFIINKKKVQRLVQKHDLQVKSYTRKSRKYSYYKNGGILNYSITRTPSAKGIMNALNQSK